MKVFRTVSAFVFIFLISNRVLAVNIGYAGVTDMGELNDSQLFHFSFGCNDNEEEDPWGDQTYPNEYPEEDNQNSEEESSSNGCEGEWWKSLFKTLQGAFSQTNDEKFNQYIGSFDSEDDMKLFTAVPTLLDTPSEFSTPETLLTRFAPSFAHHRGLNSILSTWIAFTSPVTDQVAIARHDVHGRLDFISPIGAESRGRPDIAVFKNKLFVAYRGVGTSRIYVAEQKSRYHLGSASAFNHVRLSGESADHPNLAVFQDKLYVFYRGKSSKRLWYAYTSDGVNWSKQYRIPNGSESNKSPYPTVMGDTLYLFYKGGSSNRIWFSTTQDGSSWSSQTRLPGSLETDSGPAAAARNGELFVFFRGQSTERVLYASSIDGGITWSDYIPTGARTSGSLTAVGYSSSGPQVTYPTPTPVVLPDQDDPFWDMIGNVMP